MNKKHRFLKTDAQSTTEYAVLVACIVAAVIGMQIYLKRGIQGRLRQAGDEVGQQYSATGTESTITTTTNSTWTINQSLIELTNSTGSPIKDSYNLSIGGLETNTTFNENTTKTGNEKIGAFENELF